MRKGEDLTRWMRRPLMVLPVNLLHNNVSILCARLKRKWSRRESGTSYIFPAEKKPNRSIVFELSYDEINNPLYLNEATEQDVKFICIS
jgi:hypothetical protein